MPADATYDPAAEVVELCSDLIGIDKIMWEADFPHNDSNWPDSRKVLADALADVPDDDARRIAESNARQLYRFPAS